MTVSDGRIGKLADAILFLKNSPALIDSMGKNTIALLEEFSLNTLASKFSIVLKKERIKKT
jgi:hypothetical protein